MKKGKSPGLDGLKVEFFIGFYDLLKDNLLKVVHESKRTSRISHSINSTSLVLIPKTKEVSSSKEFLPIPLYNMTYKIISKIVANFLKPMLSEIILKEQFGFFFFTIRSMMSLLHSRSPSLH